MRVGGQSVEMPRWAAAYPLLLLCCVCGVLRCQVWRRRDFGREVEAEVEVYPDVDAFLLEPHYFLTLCDDIRRWAPLIQQGSTGAAAVEAKASLEAHLLWLSRIAESVSPEAATGTALVTSTLTTHRNTEVVLLLSRPESDSARKIRF